MTLLFNSESADTFFHYLDADFILHRFVFNLKQQAIRYEQSPVLSRFYFKKSMWEKTVLLFSPNTYMKLAKHWLLLYFRTLKQNGIG